MGISFKTLAAHAARKAVNDLSDAPITDAAQIATIEAKGAEALAELQVIAKAEAKAQASTPEGIRKLLIAKRAGQARLATASILADMGAGITTVQARRGADITESNGKGKPKTSLAPRVIAEQLQTLLSQPGALKESIEVYDPARKGAKPAPAPLLACRLLAAALTARARLNQMVAEKGQTQQTMAKAG